MANIRVIVPFAALGEAAVHRLQAAGHTVSGYRVKRVRRSQVTYGPTVELSAAMALAGTLRPIDIRGCEPAAGLGDVDMEVSIAGKGDSAEWPVLIHADSSAYADKIANELLSLGLQVTGVELGPTPEVPKLQFGGAPPLVRALVAWTCARLGTPLLVEEKAWDGDDRDLWLHLADPALAGLTPRQRHPVVVATDAPEADACRDVFRALIAAGFHVEWAALNLAARFSVSLGLMGVLDGQELIDLARHVLGRHDLDPSLYPIQPAGPSTIECRLELPLAAWASGALAPYAGPLPPQFQVQLITDDVEHVEPLRAHLVAEGFRAVSVVHDPEVVGPYLQLPGDVDLDDVPKQLLRHLTTAGFDVSAIPELATPLPDGPPGVVTLCIPSRPVPPMRLRDAAADLKLMIHGTHLYPVVEALKDLGFTRPRCRPSPVQSPCTLTYGRAHPALIAAMAQRLVARYGKAPELHRTRDTDEPCIHLDASTLTLPAPPPRASRVEPEDAARSTDLPFLDASDPAVLRVGDLTLPRRQGPALPLVPSLAEFAGYCVDRSTAETLHHLALAVLFHEPCLLEGGTGTSKTSSVRYLAALLGQPVVRVNLNGQTDTGELLGRFVPDTNGAGGWRWQDGVLIQAMREGWWVLLDEVNLAEAQILERLNPVLEDVPSLVLTEHRNEVFGPAGEPVHPAFQVFATMNPSEYAGRSALSPAWRDRWRAFRQVGAPDEDDTLAMLTLAVLGRGPSVVVEGTCWAASPSLPVPGVAWGADEEQARERLVALARFHTTVEHAATRGSDGAARLGAARREGYVFTRRNLHSVLHYVQARATGPDDVPSVLRAAVRRYYVDRCAPGDDQSAMLALLEASGLGESPFCEATNEASDGAESEDDGPALTRPFDPAVDEIPF